MLTEMTADDNSGQSIDLPPICHSVDRNEIIQGSVKIRRTVFFFYNAQMYRQLD